MPGRREKIARRLVTRGLRLFLIATGLACSDALEAQVGPAGFNTVTPCRVADTRNAGGPYGGPALSAGATRIFLVAAQCNVSSTAQAVSANVTVIGATAQGHLTLYAPGSGVPATSSINYRAGQTRANNVIVPLGPTGALATLAGQSSGTTHFLIDINGFFETPTPASPAVEAIKLLDRQARMNNENAPILIRGGAEYFNPELVELIGLGAGAVDRILAEFRRPVKPILDDTPLSLLAYALERIGDPRAAPALADWLEQNVFAELIWAPDFVTHTIKVLDGQGGLNTQTYTYRIDEVLDTIAQARVGLAAARGLSKARAAAANENTGVCWQTIVVNGINGAGQQESVLLTYKVARRDIDELISDPTTSEADRRDHVRRRQGWEESDQAGYGTSDYQILPGATIGYKSNCAGKVEENVLNTVAIQRGFPVRLGEGGGDATAIRRLASKFGSEVPVSALDKLTVVSHDSDGGSSFHVEVPVSANATSAVVHSKDNQGYLRQHTVDKTDASLAGFRPAQLKYGTRGWLGLSGVTTRFYRVDPNRILSIVVDASACLCTPGAPGNVPVAITQPSTSTTPARVITVAGTVGDTSVTSATLKVDGAPQSVAVVSGSFSAQAVLRSGNNDIRVDVTAGTGIGPRASVGCSTWTTRAASAPRTIS